MLVLSIFNDIIMFKSILADNFFVVLIAYLLLDSHLFYFAPCLYFAQTFLVLGVGIERT